MFFVNVPLSIVLALASLKFIDESRDPDARNLDYLGILTFAPGLSLLVWALIDGNDAGWRAPTILIRLGSAVLFFTAFVIVELWQQRPMVDFALFRHSTFLGSVFAMLGYGATAQVMIFYLPLYLQNTYDFNAEKAGLAMMPFAIPMVMAPRLTARLATHFSGRALLTSGLAITFVGNALFCGLAKAEFP